MRKLLFYLALLIGVNASAQNTVTLEPGTSPVTPTWRYKAITPDSLNHLWMLWNGKYNRVYTATEVNLKLSALNPTVTGFTVTSLPSIGQVIPTGTVDETFAALFQQSQPPTASLTGGTTYELASAGTRAVTLNYSYGKQTGTKNIQTVSPDWVNINGNESGITQSTNGASGSFTRIINNNTSFTFTLTVKTVDNKTATSSTTFSFSPRRYWGRASGAAPTEAEILAVSGGGSALSNSKTGTFVITGSGSNYPFFAYPSSLGTLTSIKDANGLEAFTSYNTGVISLTNASGFQQ